MRINSRLLNLLFKYITASTLIAVPLYPKFPFIDVPGTFVSIRLEDLLIAFSAILLVIAYFPKVKILLQDKLVRSIVLFLLVGLASLFSAVYLTKTVSLHLGFFHWARRVEYFIPLFLGIEAIRRDRKSLGFYFKILLLVVFTAFIYGVGQKNFEFPIIVTQNEEYSKGVALRYIPGSHINSTFAGHYDLATFLVLALPIVISAIFLLKGRLTKFLLIAASFSGMWLLVNTASRISLFSYLVATTLALILIKKYKVIPVVLIISIMFVSFSSNLLARYERFFEVGLERIMRINLINDRLIGPVYAQDVEGIIERREVTSTPTPIPVFEDRSTNIRLNVEWPRALRAFSKNPFLGTGYSSITLATDNDYLRLLGEVGILGFFAFFLIFAQIGLIILRNMPIIKNFQNLELAFLAGFVGAIPGLFTNAVFIDLFEASKFATIFWLFTGFAVSLLRNEKSEQTI